MWPHTALVSFRRRAGDQPVRRVVRLSDSNLQERGLGTKRKMSEGADRYVGRHAGFYVNVTDSLPTDGVGWRRLEAAFCGRDHANT